MRGAFPALVFSGRRKSVVTPKKTQPIHLVWIGCVRFGRGAGVFQLERFALEWNSGRHVPACRVTSVPELVRCSGLPCELQTWPRRPPHRRDYAVRILRLLRRGGESRFARLREHDSNRTCPEQISAAFRIRRPRRVPAIRCWYFLREPQRPDGRTSCPSPRRASA